MKFWEAMREMQENEKKVRPTIWASDLFFQKNISVLSLDHNDMDAEWEIYEEPSSKPPKVEWKILTQSCVPMPDQNVIILMPVLRFLNGHIHYMPSFFKGENIPKEYYDKGFLWILAPGQE